MAFIKDRGMGEIAFIRPSIIRDIEIVLDFVEKWNKNDEDLRTADCAARIETYLRDYRLAEAEKEAETV